MIRIERLGWDGRDAPALAARLRAMVPMPRTLTAEVTEILDQVRDGGDAALRELGRRFDEPVADELRVDPELVAAGSQELEPEVVAALEVAARNVEAAARIELDGLAPATVAELPEGQRVEVRREPVGAAGIYAPGGRAAYPSSVLMCAVPARVAGVGRLAVATPPAAGGRPSPAVLAACALAGVDEVYAVGGAQAIAALAFGTEAIVPVDVVAGPGNRYVTEAKRLVAGRVGIDGLAGPSELFVVADRGATTDWIALDVCAQAEHGADGPLAVAAPDRELLDHVAGAAAELAETRPSVAAATLAVVETPSLEDALSLADAFAPEHLELAFDGADEAVARERVAGCAFVGAGAATAFGDYAAGSNHVLPTGGAARFGGPLGPGAFMRRTSVVSLPRVAAEALAPHVAALSRAEGLPVHGESARARADWER